MIAAFLFLPANGVKRDDSLKKIVYFTCVDSSDILLTQTYVLKLSLADYETTEDCCQTNAKNRRRFIVAKEMIGKATDLLAKCEVVTLASINEEGYPRALWPRSGRREYRRSGWLPAAIPPRRATFK